MSQVPFVPELKVVAVSNTLAQRGRGPCRKAWRADQSFLPSVTPVIRERSTSCGMASYPRLFLRILGYPFIVLPTHCFSFSSFSNPQQSYSRLVVKTTASGESVGFSIRDETNLRPFNQTQLLVPSIVTAGLKSVSMSDSLPHYLDTRLSFRHKDIY